jgi:protease-4
MQATYELFVTRVADGRQSTRERIDAVGQGRVWTGYQARELGLVDELGGLDKAIRIAKQRAKIEAGRDVSLLVYPPKRSIYDVIANPFGVTLAMGAEVLLARTEVRVLRSATSIFERFRSGEALALMPNVFWR